MITHLQHSDIKLLRIFMQVVKHAGFSAAARALNVSQSTISIQLKLLEQRLGFALCRRGRNGFELTDEGRKIYEAAQVLENSISDFISSSAAVTKELYGALVIGVSPIVCHEYSLVGLPKLIASLRRRSPKLRVRIEMCSPSDLENGIENGEIDIACMETGFLRRDLATMQFFDMYSSIYCSSDHPLAAIPEDEIDDGILQRHRSVVFDLNASFANPLRRDDSEVTTSSESSIFLIMSGDYVGYLSDNLARPWLERGDLLRIAPERYTCNFPGGFVFRKSSLSNPIIAATVDIARKQFVA